MDNSIVLNTILWGKALWKSFLALIIGFLFYMLPGLIVGFIMGIELGPKMKDSPEMSSKISETVSLMYQENIWINMGIIVLTSLLIFWYSRKVTKGTGDKKYINGLIVGSVPAFVGLMSVIMIGINIFFIAMILVSLGSGLLGSIVQEKST
ncbi:MAG: hypothetical protein WAM24_09035 [Ignavibacteriaceae bacterium]